MEYGVAVLVERLLRLVGGVVKQLHHLAKLGKYRGGPADVVLDIAGTVLRRGWREMRGVDGVLSPGEVAAVCRDALVRVIYPHQRPGVNDPHPVAHQRTWRRVVVPVGAEIDAAVASHGELAARQYLEGRPGQRQQSRSLLGEEEFLAGVPVALHAPLVVVAHPGRDGRVEFLKGVEHGVAQRRVNPLVDQLDGVLHGALVLRVPHPGRLHHAPVVAGEVRQQPVDLGLVAVALDHGGLQVVRNQHRRDASQRLHQPGERVNEVLAALRRDRQGEAVVGVWHARHEDLRRDRLSAAGIHVVHPVAREVEIHRLSRHVQVLEHRADALARAEVLAVVVAELREPVSVGVFPPVLLPQQLHRHPAPVTPPHLFLYSWQQRRELVVAFVGVCGHAPVEASLKLRLVQSQQAVDSHGVGFR